MNRIWVRFGVYMTVTVLVTVGILAAGLAWEEYVERSQFNASLPADVRAEIDRLEAAGLGDSPEADRIYDKYWPNDGPGTPEAVLFGLGVSLFLGLMAAFLSVRFFIRPIVSVAEASLRISQGDLSVRAQTLSEKGEMADLLHNFNHMADTLERLESDRRATIAAISHELRTPLTILHGRLHALCDGVIPASPAEHRKLLDQTQHLVRLVEDLNTLSLAEAGSLSLHCRLLDLGNFLRELLPVYADRARAHGLSITLAVDPVNVMADPDRLRQVLANLIENALHYAASGGLLEIRVAAENQTAILEFNDRGPGLPSDVTERIFDPFFRLDSSRSRETGGSGLGLAVVQTLVRQHHGTVQAVNREDGGASFRITLPLAIA